MKTTFLLFLTILSVNCSAQGLEWTKKGFTADGQLVAPADWENYFQGNEQAIMHVKKAKANNGTAQVFAFIGGFMIGYPVGTAIGGGEPEWALAGVGAGFVVVALPLISATKKNMEEAIKLVDGNSSASNKGLKFNFSGNSIGLSYRF